MLAESLLRLSWPAPQRWPDRAWSRSFLTMSLPRLARKADILLALGSGQITCSLQSPDFPLDRVFIRTVASRQGLAHALQPSENAGYVAFYEAAGRVK